VDILDFQQISWLMNRLDEKVDRIKKISDTNYTGDNSNVLLEILDEVIRRYENE
jgi:hypothetical protein